MYSSNLLKGCIVKQLVRDTSLAVVAAGPVLFYSNVLFNVTSCNLCLVINNQNRTD